MLCSRNQCAISLALGLTHAVAFAQQPPPVQPETVAARAPVPSAPSTEVFRGPRANLMLHPFLIGGLVVTIRSHHTFGIGDFFAIRVENPSKVSLGLDLGNLVAVNGAGRQIGIPHWQVLGKALFVNPQLPLRVLPGAFVAETYLFDAGTNLQFPARIYFGDQLLAEITA